MKNSRRALVLLLCAPALALSACGGSDEDTIKDIVKDIDKDASALCDKATDKLLAQLGGDVEKCKEAARGYKSETDKSKVKGDITVKVNGDSATAEFDTSDGDHQKATFVKDGDDWKVDAVSGG